jgi:hypothetical protein
MPGEKPVTLTADEAADPAKAGLAMKAKAAAGGEEAAKLQRGMARQMALLPPPALTEFLKNAADSDTVRAALMEDAAVYAFSRNPKAGLTVLASLPDEESSAVIAKKVLRYFPPQDVPEVLSWYGRLPAGEVKSAALSEMVTVLKRQDFDQALTLVTALPKDGVKAQNERRSLLKALFVENSTDISPAAAEARLVAAPEEDREFLKAEIQNAAYVNLANNSKEDAVTALSTLPEKDRGTRAVELFENWAQTDPLRAVQGLAKLPDGLKTPDLYTAFAKNWTQGNVGMASQWVHDLPAGPQKEAAATGLALGLAQDYPAEAMTWAATLTDPAARHETLEKVILGTPLESRDAVESALQSLNLPDAEKAAINVPRPPGPGAPKQPETP